MNGIIWNDHQQKQYSDKKTALKITLSGNIEEKIENVRTFRFLSFRFPFELDLAKKSFFLFSESFLSMMIKMVTRWLWCDFFDVFVFGMKNERVFFTKAFVFIKEAWKNTFIRMLWSIGYRKIGVFIRSTRNAWLRFKIFVFFFIQK